MPILRSLTTKIKTVISPSPSPTISPTSPNTSSFEVIGSRKQGGVGVTRTDSHTGIDSFIHEELIKAAEKTEKSEKKERRISRFREELGVGDA